MNQALLCNWLGLAEKHWPPDHHALLGLQRGDSDGAIIEQRVHERMAKLRGYQIVHPEEATEGMNRLAQAFIVLMEQASKNGSSIHLIASPPPAKEISKEDTGVARNTVIDWREAPPPVRQTPVVTMDPATTIPGSAPVTTQTSAPATPAPAAPAPMVPLAPPAAPAFDYLEALAQQSTHATRGIGTLPLLIERIEHTRRLLVAWLRLGKYLKQAKRKLASTAEEKDLNQKWNALVKHLEGFPRFMAQPGRPGYRVAAFARLETTALMFKSMTPDQREDLARDWDIGRLVLLRHRTYLLRQFKLLRYTGGLSRGMHAARGVVNDHPLWILLGIAVAGGLCGLLYWFVF